MAVIRKYKKGDFESLELNDFGQKDWLENKDKTQLETGEAYTIEVKSRKCIVCIEPQDDGTLYIWFTIDRRISPIYVKYIRIIVDWAVRRGAVWTLSRGGKNQERLHKFLGGTEHGIFDGRTLWIRLQNT